MQTSNPAIPTPPSTQDLRAHEQKVGSSAIPASHGDNYRQPCKQGAYRPVIPAPPSTQDYQTRKRNANKPAIPATPDKNDGQIRYLGTIVPSLHLLFSFNIHFVSPNVC